MTAAAAHRCLAASRAEGAAQVGMLIDYTGQQLGIQMGGAGNWAAEGHEGRQWSGSRTAGSREGQHCWRRETEGASRSKKRGDEEGPCPLTSRTHLAACLPKQNHASLAATKAIPPTKISSGGYLHGFANMRGLEIRFRTSGGYVSHSRYVGVM